MNKKVEKAIGKALAASLVTGVAASVAAPVSAAEVDFNALYKTAFNAVKKAQAEGTQAAINEARTAINALKGTKAEFAVGEFSKQVDTVQGPKLVAIVKAIMKAQASVKQADINAAKALIEPELPAFWRNSYSQATDNAQKTLLEQVDAAVKKAAETKTAEDIAAAKALVDDLKTAASATIANIGVEAEKKLSEVTVALKVNSVQATGAKTIKVTFNTAVDTTKVTVALNKGIAPVATSSVAWNDAKTEATITAIIPFSAGEYTVKATGLADSKLYVEAERIADVQLTATQLQQKSGVEVSYAVKNQYGEAKTLTTNDVVVNAIYAKTGATLTASVAADGKFTVDASGVTVGDSVVITMTHKATGITKSITLSVVAAAKIGQISVSAPTLPSGTARLTISDSTDGLKIPYVAVDQYGNTVKLSANKNGAVAIAAADGITIISSNNNIIDPANIKTNGSSELTFRTGATSGTVLLTFILPATGQSTTLTVDVNGTAALKTFNMIQPTDLITATKDVTVDYLAADQYGATYAKKDFSTAVRAGHISFVSNNTSIIDPSADIAWNAKNELVVTPQAKGVVNLSVYIDGVVQNTITLDVQDAIVPTKIVGVKDLDLAAIENGVVTLKASNLKVVDQYGRAVDLSGTWSAQVKLSDDSETSFDLGDKTDFTAAANATVALSNDSSTSYARFKANGTNGTEKLLVKLVDNVTAVDASAYEFDLANIKSSEIASYSFNSVGLMNYGGTKTLSVVGKNAAGQTVALPSGHITLLTSDSLLFTVNGMTVTSAVDAGTGNISAWIGTTKVATVAVTSSKATPVVESLSFGSGSYELTGAANSTSSTVVNGLTKKDQYDNAIVDAGYWLSSDASIATVNPTSGVITLKASGVTTLTYIATNGKTVSVQVTVVVTP